MSFPSVKVIETRTVQLAWSGHVYLIQVPFSKAGCQSTALPCLSISTNRLHPVEHRYHLWEGLVSDQANVFVTFYLKPSCAICASFCAKFEFINCRSFFQNIGKKVFASEHHLHVLTSS